MTMEVGVIWSVKRKKEKKKREEREEKKGKRRKRGGGEDERGVGCLYRQKAIFFFIGLN